MPKVYHTAVSNQKNYHIQYV